MKVSRRVVLRGLGGATLALPFLEGLSGRAADAADGAEPFIIFLRQGNGCSAQQTYNLPVGGSCPTGGCTEPERFWPTGFGPLTPETLAGPNASEPRVLHELVEYRQNLLVVKNITMSDFSNAYADGHARGAMQCLTAQGPFPGTSGGGSEANGESLDHRVGRELNPDGRDSLFMYAGQSGGWLGGACISHRGPNNRRSALHAPWNAYQTMVGQAGGLSPEAIAQLVERNRSVNDLVREQLKGLLASPRLSSNDRQRLDLHLSSIRDVEGSLTCQLTQSEALALENLPATHNSTDGDLVFQTVRTHMDIAALAVACGYTRSVAIQVGNGNDGSTRYRDPQNNNMQMQGNYHYVSHRLHSHGSSADDTVYAGADRLHYEVDRQFAQAFKHLLDRLSQYQILDQGVSVWLNDLANGPAHGRRHVPYIMAGSAGGFLKQGQYIELDNGQNNENIARVLNTLGSAAGLRKENGDLIDDFGAAALDRRPHPDLMA